MALDLTKLTEYVKQDNLPLIRKAVIGNRSASEFNLMTGVKGATALNLLVTEVTFGDGNSCGWDEKGNSVLSQRILTPGAMKVNMSFCDKAMLKYWMNYDVRVAAGQKTLPFEEEFINGVVEQVKAQLERCIWQGDTTSPVVNLKPFDGIEKILKSAEGTYIFQVESTDTATKIINDTYGYIPSEVFEKGEVVMYVGYDTYRKYIQELIANGNLVIANVINDVAMPNSVLIPGTNVRVIPVAGLDEEKFKAVASYRDNFVYGCDLAGDEEKFEFWYSQDNREFRLAIEFTAGVQIAYPDLVVAAMVE